MTMKDAIGILDIRNAPGGIDRIALNAATIIIRRR